MIEVHELRVGNWVKNDCDDKYMQVEVDDFKTIQADPDWLLPIPISPEILEKCGFEKVSSSFYEIDLGNNIGQLQVNPYNGIVFIGHHRLDGFGINPNTSNSFPLHQLQNLFYALTGEELNVTL